MAEHPSQLYGTPGNPAPHFLTMPSEDFAALGQDLPWEVRYQWGVSRDERVWPFGERDAALKDAARNGGTVVQRVHKMSRWMDDKS